MRHHRRRNHQEWRQTRFQDDAGRGCRRTMELSMLPVGLDPGWRRMVVGRRLRLLQMAWTSGQTSAMSASATALLELAVAMLSRMSASGRSAFAPAATSHLWATARAGSATDSLCSASSTTTGASSGLLVLYQRSD